MLVLCKPGKPAYDVAKAYRPIGLLDTIGKLLSILVAADLSHLAEKHGLLPPGQYGGCPGRNTSDAVHFLTHTIKDAWRAGKVAVALFLDVQGAFPNTVKERLIHNMRAQRVSSCYIRLIDNMLTNRKTWLHFNDYTSEPIPINNGTTQGCPLSMLLYTFYNAPLIESTTSKNESSIGFVDDSAYLITANSLLEAHEDIKDLMERPNSVRGCSTSSDVSSDISPSPLYIPPHRRQPKTECTRGSDTGVR